MIKFKQFDVGDSRYEEQIEKFQIEHPQAEFLQITGGHMSHEQIWFKYDDGAEQTKLSIPKKIAELINTGDTEYIRWSFADYFIPDNYLDLDDEWEAHNKREAEIVRRKALVSAYLAGKALGVELVEVSDE
jgi:hypothetical protein